MSKVAKEERLSTDNMPKISLAHREADMSAMLRLLLQCGDKSPATAKHADKANSVAIASLVHEAAALGSTVTTDTAETLQTRLQLIAGLHVALVREKEAQLKAGAEKDKSGDSTEVHKGVLMWFLFPFAFSLSGWLTIAFWWDDSRPWPRRRVRHTW